MQKSDDSLQLLALTIPSGCVSTVMGTFNWERRRYACSNADDLKVITSSGTELL